MRVYYIYIYIYVCIYVFKLRSNAFECVFDALEMPIRRINLKSASGEFRQWRIVGAYPIYLRKVLSGSVVQ